MKNRVFGVLIAMLTLVPALVAGQTKPSGDEPHKPWPEALAACKDKSEGDACEFDAPRGHVAGTCHPTRSGELACFHPHHHHQDGGAP